MNGRASEAAAVSTAGARHAVVLSGGGARGAYEVGVLKALAEGASETTGRRPLQARIFTGTSVGAYNATFLAAHGDLPLRDGVELLEQVWRHEIANSGERCGNGVFRMRGDPFVWLDPGCLARPWDALRRAAGDLVAFGAYASTRSAAFLASTAPLDRRVADSIDLAAFFSIEPLERLLERTIDLERLRRSPAELTVLATNWTRGRPRAFTKADITDGVGLVAVRASTAIPGFFPWVEIEGEAYVDGGLLQNTPLRPAIRAGATVVHVIYLDPETANVPLPKLENTADTLYRVYVMTIAGRVKADLAMAADVTRELLLLSSLGIDAARPPGAETVAFSRILQRPRTGRPYRPLTIHRYRPPGELGGLVGLLDFRRAFIDTLIEQGYRDAAATDPTTTSIMPDRPASLDVEQGAESPEKAKVNERSGST